MSILKANLKHLYQRRGLWFLYAVVCMAMAGLVGGIIEHYGSVAGKGVFVVVLVLSNVAGLFACSMQIEVAIKPFSLCLPAHRRVKRQFLLIVSIAVNLLLALIFLIYPGIDMPARFIAVGAAFFAGMVSFWIGVLVAFSGNASAAFLGFYPVIGIIISKYDLHIDMEKAIIAEPAAICVIGLIVSAVAWILLSSEGWFRRHCGSQWLGLFDVWSWGNARKNGNGVGKLQDGALSGVCEKFCLNRIRNSSMQLKGYFTGTVYETFGPMFSKHITTAFISLMLIMVLVCTLGYLKGLGNLIYLIAGSMAINIRMPVHSTMLIAGGRRERFLSTCYMAFAVTIVISVAVTLIALMTHLIAETGYMKPRVIDGNVLHFAPVTLIGFYAPFIMVPVGFAMQLIFKKKQMPIMVAWVMFFMFCVFAAIMIDIVNIWWAIPLTISIVISWTVFLGVLWWVSMKQSLVV